MENIFIDTPLGAQKVAPEMVRKYGLRNGMLTPFTRSRLSGASGGYSGKADKDRINHAKGNEKDGDFMEIKNGFALSASEIIDLSQGTDS